MANIVGGVTSINNPRTNWAQTDKTKADFLKNKPSVANALKGTASGEAIAITDASPIEHEMGVRVSGVSDISTIKVKKYGKNIYNPTKGTTTHKGITFEKLNDNSYHIYGTNDGTGYSYIDNYISLPAGKYTGSGCPDGGSPTTYFVQFYNRDTGKSYTDYGNGVEFEVSATQSFIVQLSVRTSRTIDLIFKPMIEAGTGDKVFEPYIEPTEYPVNADGTVDGVTSLYPVTTLMTDTAGAVIDCTYNRDANKVIADLEAKLNTLIATIAG